MTGYVYNGKTREGWPDLETLNAAILATRTPGRPGSKSGDSETCFRHHLWAEFGVYRRDGTRRCTACDQIHQAERSAARAARRAGKDAM